MNVFDLRDRLVGDYASYTRSFIKIADPRILQTVESALVDLEDLGALWVKRAVCQHLIDCAPGRNVGLSCSVGSGQNSPNQIDKSAHHRSLQVNRFHKASHA